MFLHKVVGIIIFPLLRLYCIFLPTDFFLKHGVAVMTVRELFEFVTDPSITHENMDAYLSKVRWGEERKEQEIVICAHVALPGTPNCSAYVRFNSFLRPSFDFTHRE